MILIFFDPIQDLDKIG